MKYFAYGSNMCTGRLRKRVPSCGKVSVARLSKHVLLFHKESEDGSVKADAYFTGDTADEVWGVVFDINNDEKSELDKAEGLNQGYLEKEVEAVDEQNVPHNVWLYYAEESYIDETMSPYSWYKRFVVEGARQHRLPETYVSALERIESHEDSDESRDKQNKDIQC